MKHHKKKFIKRLIVFVIILTLPLLPEMIAPEGAFNYRTWEQLSTHKLNLDRPFYVSQTVSRIEEGDTGHDTPYAVKKQVIWTTDEYGYRNKNPSENVNILVIGDSTIVGSSLSQNETFTTALHKLTGQTTYSLARADINTFIAHKRFQQNKPDIVIVARIERNVWDLPKLKENSDETITKGITILEKAQDKIDSMLKFSFYRSLFAKLKRTITQPNLILHQETGMLFYETSLHFREKNMKNLDDTTQTISDYKNYFTQNNIQFYFLVIPDKETIYAHRLPESHKQFREYTNFIPLLFQELENNNVNIINIYDTYNQEHAQDLYHLDDTHWNSYGVRTAAEIARKQLFYDSLKNKQLRKTQTTNNSIT